MTNVTTQPANTLLLTVTTPDGVVRSKNAAGLRFSNSLRS